jgi:hypothetical protein
VKGEGRREEREGRREEGEGKTEKANGRKKKGEGQALGAGCIPFPSFAPSSYPCVRNERRCTSTNYNLTFHADGCNDNRRELAW